ncbi:hypothetical protein ACFGVS_00630 [Mucilaginibacter sp. AW1-7]|uniref:hypothetical protein n=1 Tax=Mucilaginibacter sp. AW1-7 TaxID=3349874 RepID=UPI003F734063
MANKFSLKKISYLLKAKMYEKHGIRKKDYIELCKQTWGSDQDNGVKIITDALYPMSTSKMIQLAGYHLDFSVTQYLATIPTIPAEEGDNGKFLSCIFFLFASSETKEITTVKRPKTSYPEYWSDKTVKEGTYFLAFFDVLGFEKLVEQKTPLEVYAIYDRLVKKARANRPYIVTSMPISETGYSYLGFPEFIAVPFKYAYYSDSILFWTPGDAGNLSGFVAKCADFFVWALKSGILLRGTISFGNAILNKSKNIFIGKPLNEAVRLEKEQQWGGFIFGDSIYENGVPEWGFKVCIRKD